MKKWKKLKGADTEELFMYFLFIQEFRSDLFVPYKDKYGGGLSMPEKNADIWDRVACDIQKDLRLRDVTIIKGKQFSCEDLWQFLREMWKNGYTDKQIWEVAEIVSERWGDFQY